MKWSKAVKMAVNSALKMEALAGRRPLQIVEYGFLVRNGDAIAYFVVNFGVIGEYSKSWW
jgi:hypothetical protein